MTQIEMDAARASLRIPRLMEDLVAQVGAIAKKPTRIYWDQRRYEVAKEMLPFAAKFVTDALLRGDAIEGYDGKNAAQVVADCAVIYADALIERLMNG